MTRNAKTRRYLFLTVVLIFSLTTLSCGLLGGGKEEESKATQPPAAEVTKAAAEKATPAAVEATNAPSEKTTPAGEQPTEPPSAGKETPPPAGPSGETGPFDNPEKTLDSYRMRATMRMMEEGEGLFGGDFDSEVEWVREPAARHTVMYDSSGDIMMEIIMIEDDNWMNMGDGNWIHTKSGTEEEAPFSPEDFQARLEDILKDMESGMKEVGKDTVDGVRCKRYTVDADVSMPFPVPEDVPEQAQRFLPKEMEGHVEGEICVADERGLPQVIIRSQTVQELTLKYASGKEEAMVYEEKRELYDLNKPIAIEPPQGAMAMPSMPTPSGAIPTTPPSSELPTPSGGQPSESIEVADLDSLDSYRLEMSVQTKMSTGGGMTTGFTMEWVREPPARHLVMGLGESPLGEYIWIDDTVWVKLGDNWVEGTEEDAADALDNVGDVMTPEEDMVLVGEETVNDVRCNHYVYDFEVASQKMHKEVWVANQSDLPPVVIRGLFRMETTQMTIESEANVYDINTPITIEPPQ